MAGPIKNCFRRPCRDVQKVPFFLSPSMHPCKRHSMDFTEKPLSLEFTTNSYVVCSTCSKGFGLNGFSSWNCNLPNVSVVFPILFLGRNITIHTLILCIVVISLKALRRFKNMEAPICLTCPKGDTEQECAMDFLFPGWTSCVRYSCYIPYNGKLARQKTFASFMFCWPFTNIF